ncbi:hypothetical protein DFH11DRAFT_1691275 [Phellopilus nigrolimitatus]|nr:hypothetical protein DFH11DRAFT_1691275 [Phellopilus nigrolimitatus]
MSFDVSAVPIDIWFGIASFCGLEEILCLEATSKLFLEVVSNKLTWLEYLHALDQNHAPDLPRHVPLSELSWSDLRTLVVRARRRHLNCSGSAPPRPTREITVPIGSANADGALGKPHGAGTDVTLLPGSSFLLVHWSAGHLQCWDVLCGVCVWTYPPRASSDASGMQTLRVCSFSYDMQPNGDARVLVVSESTNSDVNER